MSQLAREFGLVSASSYSRKKVLDAYLAFVKVEFTSAHQDVSSCGKHSMAWDCVGDDRHRGYRPLMCRNPLCPFCSEVFSKRLVDYLMYRVHEIYSKLHRKIRFYRYEFTVPFDLQGKVTVADLPELDRMAKEVFVAYLGKSKNLRLGIVQVPQVVHSSDPFGTRKFGGWFPHVHGVCFDFGFDEKLNRIVPFSRMFFSDGKGFVRLRAMWRTKLEARWGKSRARDVDAYVRYEEGGVELKHRLSYILRSPVFDFYKWVSSSGVPKDYDPDWVRVALGSRSRKQRVHYYGWMSAKSMSPKSDFMKFLGLKLLDRKSYSKERKKVHCPKCGCIMEPIPSVVEDTDELLCNGSFFLVPLRGFRVTGGG